MAFDCTRDSNKLLVEEKMKARKRNSGNGKQLSQRATVGNR